MSSGFHSDVLQLLSLNSVNHGGSWKQHAGCLQTEAAAAAPGSDDILPRYQRRFGSLADGGPAPDWTPEPERSEWLESIASTNLLTVKQIL